MIVELEERPIEIQIRSELQHVWAEVSERLSDSVGIALKYGGGPRKLQHELLIAAKFVALFEDLEAELAADSERRRDDPVISEAEAILQLARARAITYLRRLSEPSDTIESNR